MYNVIFEYNLKTLNGEYLINQIWKNCVFNILIIKRYWCVTRVLYYQKDKIMESSASYEWIANPRTREGSEARDSSQTPAVFLAVWIWFVDLGHVVLFTPVKPSDIDARKPAFMSCVLRPALLMPQVVSSRRSIPLLKD